jgi:hypothetical protein
MESDYDRRMRETLAALSGGRVTEMPARPVEAEPVMTTGDVLRATTLSGTHTKSTTMRGRGWGPAEQRERLDWGRVPEAWPRGPDGRFIVIRHEDDEDDLDG